MMKSTVRLKKSKSRRLGIFDLAGMESVISHPFRNESVLHNMIGRSLRWLSATVEIVPLLNGKKQ